MASPLEGRKTRRRAGGSSAVGGGPGRSPGDDRGGPEGFAFGSRSLAALIAGVLVVVVVVAAVVGYRDNDDADDRAAGAGPSTSEPTSSVPEPVAAPTTCRPPTDIPAAAGKPTEISAPDEPVDRLEVQDLRPGSGPTANDGARLTMQYVGVSCASGRQFDASWDRGEPFEFTLGAGDVIPGWDEGIRGMQQGGRRLLWIPADLGYGAQGRPPQIAPGDTLVFVVDLVGVA